MASGHLKNHRPMYPEYQWRKPTLRNLLMLKGRSVYDETGLVCTVCDFNDLSNVIFDTNSMLFVDSILDSRAFPFLEECVNDPQSKVLCSKLGVPHLIRIRGHSGYRGTRWIVEGDNWKWTDDPVIVDQQFLKDMWDLYSYIEVGMFPTPGSLGKALMRKVYTEHNLSRHTGVSLAAEDFLRKHSVGGIIDSPGMGNHYDELGKIDRTADYLNNFVEHVDGAAIPFGYGDCDSFASFFALCEVEVKAELALGPFPVKVRGKNGAWKVIYPTLPGRYQSYMWKRGVEDSERAGCRVAVRHGIGFTQLSRDNEVWAKAAYWLRKRATNSFIEKQCKRLAVSAIGSHAQRRTHYYLIGEDLATDEDEALIDINGQPLRIYKREEYDATGSIMVHWNKYTVDQSNGQTYRFALPYAEQGRLVQTYVDSVLAIDDGGTFIRRYSDEARECEPGTWLYETRHNVDVVENGYTSDEEDRLPGVKRDE